MDSVREKYFHTLSLSERLKFLRQSRKKTQREIADMLCVDRSTYTCYEIGKTEPRLTSIIRLAQYYDISLDFMLKNLSDIDD